MLRRRPRAEPAAPDGVVIGTLASAHEAIVGPDGSVHPGGGGLSFTWFVGAADGWHAAATERPSAIGQLLHDGLPVVETSLRVPGGQVLQRAWAVADRGATIVVLEIENRGKEAASVALACTTAERTAGFGMRMHLGGSSGSGTATIEVRHPDGAVAVVLPRRPARLVRSWRDGAVDLEGGAEVEDAPFDLPGAGAAPIWPLAHTASLRVALVLDGAWDGDVASLPDADSVARGWRGHVDAGARVALPDPALQAAVATARATLLVRAARPHPSAVAAGIGLALGAWGHHDASLAPIEHLLDRQRLDGSFDREAPAATADALAAWALHVVATGDAVLADRLAEPAAKAAHRLAKQRWKSAPPAWVATAQLDAAAVLDLADQPEAASLCRERAASSAAAPPGAPAPWGELTTDGRLVGGPDVTVAVSLLRGVRERLVDDATPGHLRLLTAWPDEWLGADLEAHRVPTRSGLLAFAVRWHGARPALLWELDGDATITVPGLDPSWSSGERAGEALLAPVEPAGGLPGVVQPLGVEGTPADEAPDDGASFA